MALSKRRLLSFFMAFLMVFNMLPTAALAATPGTQEIGSDPLKTQTRGAAYTVSLDLQDVNGKAAEANLSSGDYHLYLCLKVQNGSNTEYNPTFKTFSGITESSKKMSKNRRKRTINHLFPVT